MKLLNSLEPRMHCPSLIRYALAEVITLSVDITLFAVCLFVLPFNLNIEQSYAGAILVSSLSRVGRSVPRTLAELFTSLFYLLREHLFVMVYGKSKKTTKQRAMEALELYQNTEPLPPPTSFVVEVSMKKMMEDPEQKKFMESIVEEITRKILAENKK